MGFANRRGNWSKAEGRTQINHTFKHDSYIIGPADYTIIQHVRDNN